MKVKDLSKFIKESVESLKATDDGTTFRYVLDDVFAVYVGWGDGFDENDETTIHSKTQPQYCICVKIAENIPNFSWEDAYMPWDTDTEEVYDTDTSISVNEDYDRTADWLLSKYKDIKTLYNEEKLTF